VIKARALSVDGEKKFKEYISTVRENLSVPRPNLNSAPFSIEFIPELHIEESISFNSKAELARYIQEQICRWGLKRENVIDKNLFWSWLAYIWFDQLTLFDPDTGYRIIKEEAKYVCSRDYRDYYRHLVAGPYLILSLLGPRLSRIFLHSPVYEHNDFIEQIASRQFLITHPNLIEVVDLLYWDENKSRPKQGAQSRNKLGNLRRFIKVIQQLELTYDIYSLSKDDIVHILPDEFRDWLNQ
jgi:hypothetical protein